MSWTRFLLAVMPALVDLAKALFVRHGGDVAAAKAEISRIPDYWANVPSEDAEIDKQLDTLRKEGK